MNEILENYLILNENVDASVMNSYPDDDRYTESYSEAHH